MGPVCLPALRPGLGQEVGANLGLMPALYQGLFLSPTVVSGALKGAVFAANIYEKLGFACVPNATESRHDIIQAVTLGSAEAMVAFCKGIQAAAPVDSYVTPEPWAMPGYDSDVIMAAGAFVQGSSIELSADGPIRPLTPSTSRAASLGTTPSWESSCPCRSWWRRVW